MTVPMTVRNTIQKTDSQTPSRMRCSRPSRATRRPCSAATRPSSMCSARRLPTSAEVPEPAESRPWPGAASSFAAFSVRRDVLRIVRPWQRRLGTTHAARAVCVGARARALAPRARARRPRRPQRCLKSVREGAPQRRRVQQVPRTRRRAFQVLTAARRPSGGTARARARTQRHRNATMSRVTRPRARATRRALLQPTATAPLLRLRAQADTEGTGATVRMVRPFDRTTAARQMTSERWWRVADGRARHCAACGVLSQQCGGDKALAATRRAQPHTI